ncbi:hypothetical protein [Marinicauda salina]|uniref:hypothetical protein n=1 Tax=Marinicauda salina TaxID=2135793 RepID=UPI0011B239C6|nr:hypothetical protein [Marinicauda salina]
MHKIEFIPIDISMDIIHGENITHEDGLSSLGYIDIHNSGIVRIENVFISTLVLDIQRCMQLKTEICEGDIFSQVGIFTVRKSASNKIDICLEISRTAYRGLFEKNLIYKELARFWMRFNEIAKNENFDHMVDFDSTGLPVITRDRWVRLKKRNT